MRCIVQRVLSASVTVDGALVSSIGPGLCVLVGIAETDTPKDFDSMAGKLVNLRLFDSLDGATPWALGVGQRTGEILLVSQFTLCHVLKGNKLDFHRAMKTERARKAFDDFVALVGGKYDRSKVKTGAFGEMMKVDIANDGPVTCVLDYPQTPPNPNALPSASQAPLGGEVEE